MPFSNNSYNLRIELDTKNYQCTAEEIQRMERALDALHRITEAFPVSDLYVTVIHHERSQDFHVKTALVLCGRTLFTGERHQEMYTAYELCISKLVAKVAAYKSLLDDDEERSKLEKGTHQKIIPTQLPDREELEAAVNDGDYVRFRNATLMYEEPVRKRIGRWIQRFPELDQYIGERIPIADVVEGVFLIAFEDYEHKPNNVPTGDWLEGLIDREIRDLASDPDGELENISLVRSSMDTQ